MTAPTAATTSAPATTTTTFYVYASTEATVLEVAGALGVEVELSEVPWEYLVPEGVHEVTRSVVAAAKRAAAAYRSVSITSPASEERVVAMAKKVEGEDVFYDFKGGTFWDTAAMDSLDYARCDVCGIAHRRVKVYAVERTDGSTYFAGGTCAAHLDLGVKAAALLAGFKSLRTALAKGGDEWFDGFGGWGARAPTTYPVATVLALASYYADEFGWVSAKAAWNSGDESTKSRLEDTLICLGSSNGKARAAAEADVAAAFDAASDTLVEDADAFMAAKAARGDSPFVRNCLVALATGSKKLVGLLTWVGYATVADARKEAAAVRAAARAVEVTPYEPETVEAKLALAVEAGLFEPAASKAVARDKMTKALVNKLTRWTPGEWTVDRSRTFDTDFGPYTIMVLVRTADSASILWKTSSPFATDRTAVKEGDVLTLDSASVGEVPPARTGRDGRTYQDGRRISRAKVTVVRKADSAAA